MTEPTLLAIENLSISLPSGADRAFAVEGVTLTVNRNEIVCLVGESGSGKSVTSLTVMGLLQKGSLVPSGGSIKLVGENSVSSGVRRVEAVSGTGALSDTGWPARSVPVFRCQ